MLASQDRDGIVDDYVMWVAEGSHHWTPQSRDDDGVLFARSAPSAVEGQLQSLVDRWLRSMVTPRHQTAGEV